MRNISYGNFFLKKLQEKIVTAQSVFYRACTRGFSRVRWSTHKKSELSGSQQKLVVWKCPMRKIESLKCQYFFHYLYLFRRFLFQKVARLTRLIID